MSESEIFSFTPRILSCGEVPYLLFFRQSIPFPVTDFVAPDIICLGKYIQEDIHYANTNQSTIRFPVCVQFLGVTHRTTGLRKGVKRKWRLTKGAIGTAVGVRVDYSTHLNKHAEDI